MGSQKKISWKYIENSIYSYGAKDGKHKVFKMPLLMFTDLDGLVIRRHRDLNRFGVLDWYNPQW
jgi:hypothetical protein